MVTICQICGDKGFSVALIYCDKCQIYAEHRYCLDVLPATFTEYVIWFCEDCAPKVVNPNPEKSTPAPVITKNDRAKSAVFLASEQVEIPRETQTSLQTTNICGPTIITKVRKSPVKSHTSLKRKIISECTTNTEVKKHATKLIEFPNLEAGEPSKINYDTNNGETESNKVDQNQKLGEVESSKICLNPVNQARLILEDKVNTDQDTESGKLNTNDPLNIPEQIISVPARPIEKSVWRGRFSISGKNFSVMDGLAAHLSTHACLKVCEEASLLPELLFTDMLLRDDVWPNSFKRSEPTDLHIALYIFPENERDERGFEKLVKYMIDEDLAMRAVALNAELLVFTSCQLPLQHWRFEANYYLWGVFRSKQEAPLTARNSSNESNISVVSTGPEKNGGKTLSSEGRSSTSHLSNASFR